MHVLIIPTIHESNHLIEVKEIILTQNKVALVDDRDYEQLSCYNWQAKLRRLKDGSEVWYAKRRKPKHEDPKKSTVYMHRQILGITDGAVDVDHHDGNGLNNQRPNLRVCNRSDNGRNRSARGKRSAFKGVYPNGRGWSAKLKLDGKQIYLGSFPDDRAAALAYDKAAIETGNPFYRLNFPELFNNNFMNNEQAKSITETSQAATDVAGQSATRIKYLVGHPRQYRFDAKEGGFNINGADKLGNTLTFQPIAWRIFTDNILNMGTKNWAEIFFVDDKNCVSAVLFHGYSVDNIFRLIEPLYYDDLTLADVVITATAEKKENNKIQPKGIYHIASFAYSLGTPERTAELKQFAQEHKIFRQETLTDIANIKTAFNYYNPFASLGDENSLPSGVDPDTGEVLPASNQ